jgi:hypothetical protein
VPICEAANLRLSYHSALGVLRKLLRSASDIFRGDLNFDSIKVGLGHIDRSLPETSEHMGSAIGARGTRTHKPRESNDWVLKGFSLSAIGMSIWHTLPGD